MALHSDHCENSEIYFRVDDFAILTELQFLSSLRTKSKLSREQEQCCAHEMLKWI